MIPLVKVTLTKTGGCEYYVSLKRIYNYNLHKSERQVSLCIKLNNISF